MNRKNITIFAIVFMLFAINFVVAVNGPQGTDVLKWESSSTKTDFPAAKSVDAIAGNITELTINATQVTKAWQGYYGTVNGVIVLDDSSNMSMYDWNDASPSGNIYAVDTQITDWSDIECFNMTANGTALETSLNIGASDADGINETFSGTTHNQLNIGTVTIPANTCPSTQTYINDGASTGFTNILLYDPSQSKAIWTTEIHQDTTGFDNVAHDFQLMVPEDGHNGDTTVTPYYFYVELA